MKIRDAIDSDLKAITDLIIACSKKYILPEFSEEGVQAYLSSHSIEKMQDRLQSFRYQVLEDESNEIVGVVGMQLPSHLYHLHVSPKLHGQGYGRKLWKSIEQEALAKSKPLIFTVNSSTYAVPFYKKLGFVPAATETKNGVTYVPMKMTI